MSNSEGQLFPVSYYPSDTENKLDVINTSLAAIQAVNTTQNSSITAIEAVNTTQSSSITGINNSLSGINNSLSAVQAVNTTQNSSITGINNSLSAIEAVNTTQNSSITGINTSLSAIEAVNTTQSSSITGINNSLSGINNSLSAVQAVNTTQNSSITGINNSLSAIEAVNTTQNSSITGINTSLSAVQAVNTTQNSSISILQSNVAILDSQASANTLNITTLQAVNTTQDTQITSKISIPSTIKTVANAGDYFIGIDSLGALYRIAKSDLLAGLSSGGTGGTQAVILTYSSNGDDKGLFYYLGTTKLTLPWSNPHTSGFIEVIMSSSFDSSHNNPQFLCDRQTNHFIATSDIANSSYIVDIKTNKLKPNAYAIRNRNQPSHSPISWKFQASNEIGNWIDLDTVVNNPLAIDQWYSKSIISPTNYRYFRLLQTGLSSTNTNVFCVAELELYGELTGGTTGGTDPNFANVELLLHGDGTNNSTSIIDFSSRNRTVTTNGNAIISTAQSKFTSSSIYFDGTGDFLSTPVDVGLTFGTSNLTWEAWVYPQKSSTTIVSILGNARSSAGDFGLFLGHTNSEFRFRNWLSNNGAFFTMTVNLNQWYHVAVTKSGTIARIWVNGIEGTSGTLTSDNNSHSSFLIGNTFNNSGFASDFQGFMNEVRLTKGTLRYTANFTPPTAPFPNS